MKTLMCILLHAHTCTHVHALRHPHIHAWGIYQHIASYRHPDPCVPHFDIRFVYIAAVLPETYKHTDSLLRSGLKACSFLHFLLLTYTFEISFACTHFLLQTYSLLHAHCHTPTYRPNHFLSSFLFPISFFFIPTHTVILAFLFSLSLTHTVCFLLSHKLGYSHFPSTRTHRQAIPCLMPIARTPSAPPAPTWGSLSTRAATRSGEFSVAMRPSGGIGAAREGLSPWSPDLPHPELAHWGTGNVSKPGHLQLCISQNLGWSGLTSAHF